MPAPREDVPTLGNQSAETRSTDAHGLHEIGISEGCRIVRVTLGDQITAEVTQPDTGHWREKVRAHDFAAVVAAALTASALLTSALALASSAAA